MKQADVKEGGTYRARVSGKLVNVKVIGTEEKWSRAGYRTWFKVVNLTSKRKINMTAARLRYEVPNGGAETSAELLKAFKVLLP